MLKKHKNGLLDIIREKRLDPTKFDVEEDETENLFTLVFRNAPFRFVVRTSENSHYELDVAYTMFAPGLPFSKYIPQDRYEDIDFVYRRFGMWLETDLKEYLDEQVTPDLWEQIKAQKSLAPSANIQEEDFSDFTEEEKTEIRLSLEEFRFQIKETFNPSDEQSKTIDARLEYVSGALDRLNRFDWKSTLISTTLSISIALSLDTTQGHLLWELAKRVVSTVLMLAK